MTAGTPRVRGALFDLDGTLVDSLPTIAEAAVEAFTRHGHPVTAADIIPRIGPPMEVLAHEVTGAPPDECRAIYVSYQDLYYGEYIQRTPPHEGAYDLLNTLDSAGVGLAIVTNKNEFGARLMVTVQGWDGRFGSIVGRDTTPHYKPHPAPALHALQTLGVEPGEAAFVGDTEADMSCARDARIRYVVGVTGNRTPDALRAAGATHLVDTLGEAGTLLFGGVA